MTTKRLNLVLPERTVARMERIRNATMASSVTDVIKTAILTYEALVEYLEDGQKFYIKKDGDAGYTPVNFLFDVEQKPSRMRVAAE